MISPAANRLYGIMEDSLSISSADRSSNSCVFFRCQTKLGYSCIGAQLTLCGGCVARRRQALCLIRLIVFVILDHRGLGQFAVRPPGVDAGLLAVERQPHEVRAAR